VSAAITPLPSHMLREPYEAALAEGKGFDTLVDWLRAPTVSNGPFVFAEWVTGSYLRFVRNENFWHDVWFDEIVVNIYPDITVIKQGLGNGKADYTTSISNPLEAAELVAEYPNLAVRTTFGGVRQELYINVGPDTKEHPALRDARVRRALAMGINRQSVADD